MGLEVQPELGLDAEPVSESQRRVGGHGPLAGDDLPDAVGRHVDLARELGGGHPQLVQFLFEDLSGCTARLNTVTVS